ncbi:MAG: hypothetical protein DRI57_30400 [Deltaproteobacteria bacterium]|nr:MAG: hypothetical protein DRI57_30400 [Deltaproteobacteria bacterium]
MRDVMIYALQFADWLPPGGYWFVTAACWLLLAGCWVMLDEALRNGRHIHRGNQETRNRKQV